MSRGFSLHIGLNSVNAASYGGWDGALVACENDARDMQRIAVSLGYQSQMLLTAAATRDAVLRALRKAAKDLQSDDIFLLTYSGHGGQVPDRSGDEALDAKDETWVLYDGEIVDDELHEAYTQFRAGARIVVLSDSCHSGSVSRAMYERIAPIEAEEGVRERAGFRSKRIPRDIEAAFYQRHKAQFDEIQARTRAAVGTIPLATVLLISGCQDSQLSSDGDVNGLFTENLLRVWDNGKYQHGYRSFQRAIKKRMPPSQTPNYFVVGAPNGAFERQRPFTVAAARGELAGV